MRRLGPAVLLPSLLMACESGRAPSGGEYAGSVTPHPPRPPAPPIFVRGPSNNKPITPFIATAVADAQRGHYPVLVYVGATWCEPCQRFHAAALAGELDSIFVGAHLVEFDLDDDKATLDKAGYSSTLIPLFCVPKPDGTASNRRIEGSIKGPEAVNQNLVPRLRALLEESR